MSQLNITSIKNKRGDFGPTMVGLTTVSGNLNVTGTISGDGSGLTGLGNTANIKADTLTVTGVVTATTFDGALSGNATSATTATTATNVTVADESSDTSCNVLFTTAATGDLAPKSGTNLTFNSSTGALTATSFVGNLSGNATGLSGTPNIDCGTGSFTGDVDIADKIVHTGDTNTAIRFPSTDTVTIETSGSERVRVDSSGQMGLGTVSPSQILELKSGEPRICLNGTTANSDKGIEFEHNGTRTGHLLHNYNSGETSLSSGDSGSGYFITFKTDNSERMRIDSSGQVLMGSSSTTFNVVANQNNAAALHLSGGGSGSANIQIHGSNHSSDAKVITFDTNSVERLRIGSSGQIGLGGANYGTSGQVITSNGSGSAPTWQDAAGGSWNLISTVNASSSSSVAFTSIIDNTYKQYVIVGTEITTDATGNPEIVFRFKSGSTTKTASDYYHAITRSTNSAGPTRIAATSQSRAKVTGCQFTSSTNFSRAYFQLWMTGDNNSLGHMTYTQAATMYSSSVMMNSTGAQGYAGQEASAFVVDGIEFFLDTGDNMTGTFKLYGLA